MVTVVSFHLTCRRSFQTVGNRAPFIGFGQSFDHNEFSPRFIAAVQLGINRPGKRLGIVRNDTHAAKSFAGGYLGVSNNVASNR